MKNLTPLQLVSVLSLAFNRAETNAILSRRFAYMGKLNWGSRVCALLVLYVITAIAHSGKTWKTRSSKSPPAAR